MATTTDNTINLRACTDCIMLIANGDTSGNSRCETEEGEAEYLAAVAAQTEGLHLAPSSWPYSVHFMDDNEAIAAFFAGELDLDSFTFIEGDEAEVFAWSENDRYYGTDVESEFSWSGCDICRDGLGGDRHPVAAWPI